MYNILGAGTEKWLQLLQEQEPDLPMPYSDTLRGKIRKLRVSYGNLEIRLLYFFWRRTKIVITHGFLKKTMEVPNQEIDFAIRLMRDFISRCGG